MLGETNLSAAYSIFNFLFFYTKFDPYIEVSELFSMRIRRIVKDWPIKRSVVVFKEASYRGNGGDSTP